MRSVPQSGAQRNRKRLVAGEIHTLPRPSVSRAVHVLADRPPPASSVAQRSLLAVYLGFNIEHFAFGKGWAPRIGSAYPQPDVLNYCWREYGNRVGVGVAWNCSTNSAAVGTLINTALFDHCPEMVEACVARGDEIIAHGHTNAERQGEWPEARERALIAGCRDRIARATGARRGLAVAVDIARAGHPGPAGRGGLRLHAQLVSRRPAGAHAHAQRKALWSMPYPQELNDIPMIVARQMDATHSRG